MTTSKPLRCMAAAVAAASLLGCVMQDPGARQNRSANGAITASDEDCTPVVERVLPPPGVKSEADVLVEYYLAARKLPKERVLREYAEAQKTVQAQPTPFNHIKLALLLSLPVAGFQDTPRALNLLQETIKDESPNEVGLRNFAGLLQAQLYRDQRQEESLQKSRDEQRRQDSSITKHEETLKSLSQKLGEEQKKVETLQGKQDENLQTIAQLAQRLKDEQKRADSLQQKLDALTDIEKNIIERQQQGKPETPPKTEQQPKPEPKQ
jgi:DNA repair exonuclease SbcCD ATPase subunit